MHRVLGERLGTRHVPVITTSTGAASHPPLAFLCLRDGSSQHHHQLKPICITQQVPKPFAGSKHPSRKWDFLLTPKIRHLAAHICYFWYFWLTSRVPYQINKYSHTPKCFVE